MSPVINERIIFTQPVQTGAFMQPGVNTTYVQERIDLDNIELNGGLLLQTVALSSDPYLRDRMRYPDVIGFSPLMHLGHPYVYRTLLF